MIEVIFFSLIGGIFSLVGGVALLSSKRKAVALASYATPFAAGALLSAAFLDLLAESLERTVQDGGSLEVTLRWTLFGVVLFFIMERLLDWFHHHHEHPEKSHDPAARLIVIGDTVHNAIDGVAIAAAFLVSTPTGIITTLAVAAHEIPQEIGDFGLLLSKGYSRRRVLVLNALSALATTVMAIITFQFGDADRLPLAPVLALVAGFFIYIAASDIIPEIHTQAKGSRITNPHTLLLIAGVLIMTFTTHIAHRFI